MLKHFIIPTLASLIAAAMNAVAGGGSFIAFPVLTVIARQTAKLANITCTIGLWPGYVGSVLAARDDFRTVRVGVLWGYAVIGLVGGAGGAWLLLHTSADAFLRLVPWLLLFASIAFAMGPTVGRWAGRGGDGAASAMASVSGAMVPLLLIISVYNGYFGAGGGVLLLAGFGLAGMSDIKQMNALKILIQITANAAAIVLFVGAKIDIRLAALMGVASFVGGFVAMAGARRAPAWALRALVLIIAFGLTIAYFVRVYA